MTDNTTTQVTDALKPCPFCGGSAKTTERRFGVPKKWQMLWGVFCDGECGIFFDCREPSKSKAVKAWNTRASDQQVKTLTQERDALNEALSIIAYEEPERPWIIAHKAILLTTQSQGEG